MKRQKKKSRKKVVEPIPEEEPKPDPVIEVEGLVKEFGKRRVLDGVSFKVYPGETFVIVGGSGCGKSTVLRHLTGSIISSEGKVKVLGENLARISQKKRHELRKRIGVLFQSGALLESLTVAENVALPLEEHAGLDKSLVGIVVSMKLRQVGLEGQGELFPSQVSSGMRKRVALARAMALDPEVLLSDEPTSGLDPVMTAVIDELTNVLSRKIGATAVIVTHDMASAFRTASRMIMLGSSDENRGQVVFEGTPEEIRACKDPIVRQFIEGNPGDLVPDVVAF